MEKNKSNDHVIFTEDLFDIEEGNAASATDCTGLIPTAPHTAEELDSYNEIINYSPKSANIFKLSD